MWVNPPEALLARFQIHLHKEIKQFSSFCGIAAWKKNNLAFFTFAHCLCCLIHFALALRRLSQGQTCQTTTHYWGILGEPWLMKIHHHRSQETAVNWLDGLHCEHLCHGWQPGVSLATSTPSLALEFGIKLRDTLSDTMMMKRNPNSRQTWQSVSVFFWGSLDKRRDATGISLGLAHAFSSSSAWTCQTTRCSTCIPFSRCLSERKTGIDAFLTAGRRTCA